MSMLSAPARSLLRTSALRSQAATQASKTARGYATGASPSQNPANLTYVVGGVAALGLGYYFVAGPSVTNGQANKTDLGGPSKETGQKGTSSALTGADAHGKGAKTTTSH